MSVDQAVSVGLAGAGAWATVATAPTLSEGPETRLAGVWSRRPESASRLADAHGVPAFERFEDLLDACEAVALALPPTVQPDLAVAAARAGRAVLLEKPLATDVAGADRIAAAVAEAGVGSVVVLTYRFASPVRDFLVGAAASRSFGGRACFLSGAYLAGPCASGWRLEYGALLDVGPHAIDLVDAALGRVTAVRAHGDSHRWVGLLLEHEGGGRSEVSLSCRVAIEPSRTEAEVFGPQGCLFVDARAGTRASVFTTLRREFAEAARAGGGHPLDAAHGARLQRILDAAARSLEEGGRIGVAP